MNIWSADRILNRMNEMLDHAIEGTSIDNCFDETKMSAIETKLSKYLSMNQLSKEDIEKEKNRVNGLISDISHQTKTPIANLILYSELLSEQDLPEESIELLNAIHEQAKKLSFLISNMVKISRLENGIIRTSPKRENVAGMLSDVIQQARPKSEAKNITIEKGNLSGFARFDAKWTGEAIYNILDNAVKYTPEGGSIRLLVSHYSLFTRIDIKDNGIGISEEEIPKIFARFYKGAQTESEEGIGLGLYLAREIISSQGGYIKVSSRPEEGSVFSVFLRGAG